MPKLQKRSPPTNSGFGASTTGLEEGGIRYESLPQDTRQPVPLRQSYHQVAVSGALASRYQSGSHQPLQNTSHRATSQQTTSPVSPVMDAPEQSRASLPPPQIHAPQPQRKSVELRRLDGSPYETERPKHVKVAQDMFEGADPPAYKRQASDPIPPPLERPVFSASNSRPGSSHHDCSKCGKKRGDGGSRPGTAYSTVSVTPAHNCDKCGKRKTSTAASPVPSAPHSRVVSQSAPLIPQPYVAPPAAASSRGMPQPTSPTIAGPSSMPTFYPPSSFPGANPIRTCNKCGRKKKPATTPLPQGTFASTYPTPPTSAPLNRTQQAGLSILPSPIMPQIDIVPPSATTYRPNSFASANTFGDNAPLISNRQSRQSAGGIFRNNSIVRSLSRRMSGKSKRESEGPLPSQQLRASQADAGAGNLINMISNAIKDSGADKNGQREYQKLGIDDPVDRPASPFSFMSAANEDGAYEMVDMDEKEKGKLRDSDSTAVGSNMSAKGSDPRDTKSPDSLDSIYSPVAIDQTMDRDVDRRSSQMRVSVERQKNGERLDVPQYGAGSKPPITRFKSLREGVSRAASVSRQSSLKRLESLKKVHTNWYRDDMAIEGHNGGSIPAY